MSTVTLLIQADDRATQVLNKVQNDLNKVQDNITRGNEKISESTKKLNTSTLHTISSFASFTAGATALYTSFSNLDKAQLRVASAQKEVIAAQASALQAQLVYQRSVERFGETSERTSHALLRLKSSEEQLIIAQEKARLAQNDLSDTYLNFIVNLAPQTISLAIGLQGAFRAIGITSITQLVPSIHAVGGALKGAFITNPVGIAIIGIASAVTLLATNTFGLGDKIITLGNIILGFIDKHLKPLGDAIRFVIDALKPITDLFGSIFPASIESSNNAISRLESISIDSFNDIEANLLELSTNGSNQFFNLEESVNKFSDTLNEKMLEASKSIKESSLSIDGNLTNNIKVIDSIGNISLDAASKITTLADTTAIAMKSMSSNIKRSADHIIEEGTKIKRSIEDISLALLKGGNISNIGKVRMSGVIELGDGFITPGGTIVKGNLTSHTRVLNKDVIEGIRSGRITKVRASDYIEARNGFEGLVVRPTLFLAGEEGPEHVSILPSNNNHTLKLVVEFINDDGTDIGSQTLDLVNKEARVRLKSKGGRLF